MPSMQRRRAPATREAAGERPARHRPARRAGAVDRFRAERVRRSRIRTFRRLASGEAGSASPVRPTAIRSRAVGRGAPGPRRGRGRMRASERRPAPAPRPAPRARPMRAPRRPARSPQPPRSARSRRTAGRPRAPQAAGHRDVDRHRGRPRHRLGDAERNQQRQLADRDGRGSPRQRPQRTSIAVPSTPSNSVNATGRTATRTLPGSLVAPGTATQLAANSARKIA